VTRLVAGLAGGRVLAAPAGRHTRPTAGRIREALFSSLGDLRGARVLDLYAGSGAVGLEALSRGALTAVLVESDPRALQTLRANVAAVGLPGARVVAASVSRLLSGPRGDLPGPFEVAFLDPPYTDPVAEALELLLAGGWLAPGAGVVVERSARDAPLTWPEGLSAERSRRYGDTCLWYGRRS
jgi:16S rRNA (guanine(966)-N(2))-methyltransferase RsmD